MTFKLLFEIAFWTIVISFSSVILWDLIPGHMKKWWGYVRQVKRDRKAGLKGKYTFTWRK